MRGCLPGWLAEKNTGRKVQLVFLSVDPERDGVAQVREYVREFHPRMIGLTGSLEKVRVGSRSKRGSLIGRW